MYTCAVSLVAPYKSESKTLFLISTCFNGTAVPVPETTIHPLFKLSLYEGINAKPSGMKSVTFAAYAST